MPSRIQSAGSENDVTKVPFWRVMRTPENAVIPLKILVNSFDIGSYIHGMPYRIDLSDEDRLLFQGFISRCSDLAQCDPIWETHSTTVFSNEERPEGWDFTLPSEQEMAQICVIFRRVYSHEEPGANYRNVSAALRQLTENQLGRDFSAFNKSYLTPINSAVKSLKTKDIQSLGRKLLGYPEWLSERDTNYPTPEKLISFMFYGGYIHSGKHSEDFGQLKEDGVQFQLRRFDFLGQVQAYSLTYLMLGELILTLARGNGLKRPLKRDLHQKDFSY